MIICRRAIQDKETNLVSLIDCIDAFIFQKKEDQPSEPEFPVNIPYPLSLFMNWDRNQDDNTKFKGRVRAISSDNSEYMSLDIELDFDLDNSNALIHRTTINVPGITVTGFGKIMFIVEVEQDGSWVQYGKQYINVLNVH